MINYKNAGFNTLNEMFDAMLKKQAEGDHVGFIKMSSMLTSQQKVAFIDHSKGHEVFAGAIKDMVTESCGDYRVGKDYADFIKMALAKGGYIVTEKPDFCDCCSDNWSYPEVYFTDGQLIEGYVSLFQKEVHLKAVDAKERVYNKSITYLDEADLIESINHFKHDIEETFNEVEAPEISMEASVDKKAGNYTGEDAVKELVLFIVNDGRMYSQIQAVLKNLAKKVNKGVYNADLALKSWYGIASAGMKNYNDADLGATLTATPNERREVAKELQEYYAEELTDWVNDPSTMPKGGVTEPEVLTEEPYEPGPEEFNQTISEVSNENIDVQAEAGDSTGDVNTLAQYLQVEPSQITTEDGENYFVNGKTETYKVSDKALDLAEQGYQNAMHDNKYIYWK